MNRCSGRRFRRSRFGLCRNRRRRQHRFRLRCRRNRFYRVGHSHGADEILGGVLSRHHPAQDFTTRLTGTHPRKDDKHNGQRAKNALHQLNFGTRLTPRPKRKHPLFRTDESALTPAPRTPFQINRKAHRHRFRHQKPANRSAHLNLPFGRSEFTENGESGCAKQPPLGRRAISVECGKLLIRPHRIEFNMLILIGFLLWTQPFQLQPWRWQGGLAAA